MHSENSVEKLMSEMKKTRRSVKKELQRYPAANLMISRNTKEDLYLSVTYENGKRIRKGIGKNIRLVYRLAHKAYLKELLRRLDSNIALLEKICPKVKQTAPSDIIKSLPGNYDILDPAWIIDPSKMAKGPRPNPSKTEPPVRLAGSCSKMLDEYKENDCERMGEVSDETFLNTEEWFLHPYAENTSFPESKTIISCSGLKTRSKSEALILERYEAKNIPYHYDETVIAEGRLVSPDIIALRPDGTVFIHEHAGLWSDEYLERNEWKMHIYSQAGFVQGKNLLITFDDENGNINVPLIDAMIDDIAKPRRED